MLPGRATAEGTAAFARRHATPGHFRDALGLTLSSFGLGTYLGGQDAATDAAMAAAVGDCHAHGLNVVDAAIVYRDERSERSVGAGLRAAGVPREEIFVSTKGGYVPSSVPRALLSADEARASHSISTDFLAWALRRSRENLGLETVDLYYLHNPEDALPRLGVERFYAALHDAFHALETRADAGELGAYGLATWPGLRVPAAHPNHVELRRVVAAAKSAGGDGHRLRAVQLPLNLAMPEAVASPTQEVDGRPRPAAEAAHRLGLAVFTSASTMQGRVTRQVPEELARSLPGAEGSATRALLQWTRSAPNVTCALVGMARVEHRRENLPLARAPPLAPAEAMALLAT